MAPNLKDQLPILKSLLKWFTKEGAIIDSPVFRLHHQMSAYVILIGFVFTFIENYLDGKAITCHTAKDFSKYAHSFCWIHGTGYVGRHLQGAATGCFVDQDKLGGHEDVFITSYYLWLPYLLSFLFAMAKLPHSLWKRHFENNLISSIVGGIGSEAEENKTSNENGGNGNDNKEKQDEGGEGNNTEDNNANDGNNKNQKGNQNNQNQKGGNQNQNQQGGGKGKKGQQNKNQPQKNTPKNMATSFIEFRHNYDSYQRNFMLLETLNIFTLIASALVTHWILNFKFLNYGPQVIDYLSVYGSYYSRGRKLHDPMCELFPTEVSCSINLGSATGSLDSTNFLCILQNNIFNQKYFFVLWIWWIIVLMLSIIGVIYRIARVTLVSFSLAMVSRKYHGFEIHTMTKMSTSDLFVLELVIQNLNHNPRTVRNFMVELRQKIKEGNSKPRGRDNVADLEDGLKSKPSGYFKSNLNYSNEKKDSAQLLYGKELPSNIDIS